MNGYVQLTPIPEHFFKNNNVLDRMAKALDGPDPQEVMQAWFGREKAEYLNWSGLDDTAWKYSQLSGYPTKFMVFFGPCTEDPSPEEAALETRLGEFTSNLSSDVVMGDVGCILDGKSFSARAQWKVKPKEDGLSLQTELPWAALLLLVVAVAVALLLWWWI